MSQYVQRTGSRRLKTIAVTQEANMDEEGDAERAAQWNLAEADVAYKAQVEAALAQQRAAEEEQRMLLEQLEVCTSDLRPNDCDWLYDHCKD